MPANENETSKTIVTDIKCVRCDYDVRGIGVESVCPECALPIAISMRDPDAIKLDAQWLAALDRGRKWLFLVFPVVLIAGCFISPLFHSLFNSERLVYVIDCAIALGGLVTLTIGFFLFTDASCKHWLTRSGLAMRSLVRVMSIWAIIVIIGGCIFVVQDFQNIVVNQVMVTIVVAFVLGVVVFSFGGFVKNVALVLVDDGLIEKWHFYRFVFVLSWLTAVISPIVVIWTGDNFFCCGIPAGIIGLLMSIIMAVRILMLPQQLARRIAELSPSNMVYY